MSHSESVMETSPSSGKSRQRPSLSFVARNVFLLGGLLVMGTLASFLVYGWLSFLGPLQDAARC